MLHPSVVKYNLWILYKKLNCPSSWLSCHLKWLYLDTTQAWVSGQCNSIQATETLISPVILSLSFSNLLQQVSEGRQDCFEQGGMCNTTYFYDHQA